ncbi:hypothetical protein [Enterobacter cloacae complex sp. P31C]|uniref:hypothetical protein n=1 Tax=Enterobacter cloacae complex sp. P31C TaxID=2779560 RepID=UPI001866B0EF|nr:hypothetical protein [Enterobacter cloacae complex sp. P31C]MBE3286624.1 hypothetical protein [Enterobacter cloacae complex sp. P31C]
MNKQKNSQNTTGNGENSEEVSSEKKTCFVIMPFTGTAEYEPGHFDRVYEYLIKPACKMANFEPIRGDDSKASNMIMLDVLRNIIDCDMAICDLSSINANVFYELGLRQAFDKKTILIRDGLHAVPFDLLGFRYVPYSPTLRVDTVKSEIQEIAAMLQDTHNDSKIEANSIVSILKMKPATIDTKNMNQEESMMFEVLNRMKRLERTVSGNLIDPAVISNAKYKNSSSSSRFLTSKEYYLAPDLMESLRLTARDNTASLFQLLQSNTEKISQMVFRHNDRMLGFYIGKTSTGLLEFRLNDRVSYMPDNLEMLNEIVSY